MIYSEDGNVVEVDVLADWLDDCGGRHVCLRCVRVLCVSALVKPIIPGTVWKAFHARDAEAYAGWELCAEGGESDD